MYTILLLTEKDITEHDARRIAELHEGDQVEVHVLVPGEGHHNSFVEALDDVALGHRPGALEERGEVSPHHAEQDAMHALNVSVDRLTAAGLTARGSVTGADPVPAAIEAVRQYAVDEVVVVTPPHLVREVLHRDWASRLRDELKLPLLHFVTGTDRVVS